MMADAPTPPTPELIAAWMEELPKGAHVAQTRPAWIACNVALVRVVALSGPEAPRELPPTHTRLATYADTETGIIYALVAR